jgi:hypothetical protein
MRRYDRCSRICGASFDEQLIYLTDDEGTLRMLPLGRFAVCRPGRPGASPQRG